MHASLGCIIRVFGQNGDGTGMIERVTERVGWVPGGVNIGVIYGDDNAAILIDTGLNDTTPRRVLRDIAADGRTVRAIVTTHCHADHFGGNAFVVARTGARVYAPSWDETVLRYPLFQPLCLYAGADPPESLRVPFLLAKQSPVDVIYEAGPLTIAGVEMTAVSLAGHSGNQMGILVDGTFFAADVILPERVIERYRMPYLYSVTDHLASLERASGVAHGLCVPGHGPALEHVSIGVAPNLESVERVAAIVVELCGEPHMPEELLALVLERIGGAPEDPAAYYLLHPTIFAYLSHLERLGELRHEIAGGRSLWLRV
jgi:glyoxylase-like metal-dependent hydrolase (beta-lactamase superfamily II)